MTIIYVNFAPYENTGKILDYILTRFQTVLVFSFNFHRLGKMQKTSTLWIYRNGKIVNHYRLFQTPTGRRIAFLLLPLRSFVIFLQLLFHSVRLRNTYGPYTHYFTVNAFTAWTGNLMRDLGIVKHTIFWVWDYYPPVHKSKITMFMRWLYWEFDKPASLQANRVVFLNRHLYELRQNIGILPKSRMYETVEIGTDPQRVTDQPIGNTPHLVFLGVLKQIQGLDLFFDAAPRIASRFPNLVLHIVGGGPDEEHYKNRARACPLKVIFHGYIANEKNVDLIIKRCHIGIAPYIPDKSNVMYYSDPSKIKRYLNFGKPVITTDVFDFSKTIKDNRAGILISYEPDQLSKSIAKILGNYSFYKKNAVSLSKNFQYTRLYKKIFDD